MERLLDARDLPLPEATRPAAGRLLGPEPLQALRHLHTGGDGKLHVGEWSSDVGAWRVEYTETEACMLLAGRVRLTDEAGQQRNYGPGEWFLLLPGYRGTWEVLEPCRKLYVILE